MSSTIQFPTDERTDLEQQILTPLPLSFSRQLHDALNPRRVGLLEARRKRQEQLDRGETTGFPRKHDANLSASADPGPSPPFPHDLQDRRVEITGPTDRKMLINALNSGANVYMADFEDSNAPTWNNCLEGQRNLRDAICGAIEFAP